MKSPIKNEVDLPAQIAACQGRPFTSSTRCKAASSGDRGTRQMLQELALPLAAVGELVAMCETTGTPESVAIAAKAAGNHVDHLQQLLADYVAFNALNHDQFEARDDALEIADWLPAEMKRHRANAAVLGVELSVNFQGYLPSAVDIDRDLLQTAIASVLNVALQRGMESQMELFLRFDDGRQSRSSPQLIMEMSTRGGGFSEAEQRNLFDLFQVRDVAGRPLLGLSLAQRCCDLLGGNLCVESPGSSVCSYRVMVTAQPAEDAVWVDPEGGDRHLGPVSPGRVLFVGRCQRTVEVCRGALEGAGYSVERAPLEEMVLPRLKVQPKRWSAVVLDTTCTAETFDGFVDAVRMLGYGELLMALVDDSAESRDRVGGVDATLTTPTGSILLQILEDARGYSDSKKLTSAC